MPMIVSTSSSTHQLPWRHLRSTENDPHDVSPKDEEIRRLSAACWVVGNFRHDWPGCDCDYPKCCNGEWNAHEAGGLEGASRLPSESRDRTCEYKPE